MKREGRDGNSEERRVCVGLKRKKQTAMNIYLPSHLKSTVATVNLVMGLLPVLAPAGADAATGGILRIEIPIVSDGRHGHSGALRLHSLL